MKVRPATKGSSVLGTQSSVLSPQSENIHVLRIKWWINQRARIPRNLCQTACKKSKILIPINHPAAKGSRGGVPGDLAANTVGTHPAQEGQR